MTELSTTPVVCERCATTSTTLHRDLPWCQHCGIWLVLDPATGEWVSFAERDRRIREAEYLAAVTASAGAVAEALPRLTGLVPDGWSLAAGQSVPDTLHVLTLTPPPSLVQISASLRPPYQGHGWYVRIDNRTEGIDYPLYEAGGVRAAYFPTPEDALQAATAAVRIDLI